MPRRQQRSRGGRKGLRGKIVNVTICCYSQITIVPRDPPGRDILEPIQLPPLPHPCFHSVPRVLFLFSSVFPGSKRPRVASHSLPFLLTTSVRLSISFLSLSFLSFAHPRALVREITEPVNNPSWCLSRFRARAPPFEFTARIEEQRSWGKKKRKVATSSRIK